MRYVYTFFKNKVPLSYNYRNLILISEQLYIIVSVLIQNKIIKSNFKLKSYDLFVIIFEWYIFLLESFTTRTNWLKIHYSISTSGNTFKIIFQNYDAISIQIIQNSLTVRFFYSVCTEVKVGMIIFHSYALR